MSLTPAEKLRLLRGIAPHLEAIGNLFKNPRVTLLVRTPELPDGDFIMTQEEDLATAAECLTNPRNRT